MVGLADQDDRPKLIMAFYGKRRSISCRLFTIENNPQTYVFNAVNERLLIGSSDFLAEQCHSLLSESLRLNTGLGKKTENGQRLFSSPVEEAHHDPICFDFAGVARHQFGMQRTRLQNRRESHSSTGGDGRCACREIWRRLVQKLRRMSPGRWQGNGRSGADARGVEWVNGDPAHVVAILQAAWKVQSRWRVKSSTSPNGILVQAMVGPGVGNLLNHIHSEAFGNDGGELVTAEQVGTIREPIKDRAPKWTADELIALYGSPFEGATEVGAANRMMEVPRSRRGRSSGGA